MFKPEDIKAGLEVVYIDDTVFRVIEDSLSDKFTLLSEDHWMFDYQLSTAEQMADYFNENGFRAKD